MKKLSQILAVAAIVLAPFAASSVAGATTFTCQVGYHLGTGPDSTNICVSDTSYECTANENNTIAIVNENGQTATSGEVNLSENTSGGFSGSGSATNDNNITFDVTVTNRECQVAATTPVIVTPEVTPTPTVTTTKATPTVLPNTSSDATTGYIVILAAVLGIGAIASFLFAKVYSRR